MDRELEKKLLRNLKLYGPYQVFTKRVFLPLVAIYASHVAGLNVAQIGYIAATSAVASMLLETPTGFWADRHGRRTSARIGSFLAAVGTLAYILLPSFWGILTASLLVAIGYAFLSGSMSALIHDTLVILGREDDFAKVASRAQSMSLLINAGVMALVPMLYPIDERLPFVVGVTAYIVLFYLASLLTEPLAHHNVNLQEKKFFAALHTMVNRKTLLFFVCAGFMAAITTGPSDLFNLGFIKVHVKPEHIGLIFAIGSLLAAAIGYGIHYLKRLSFKQYVTLDAFSCALVFLGFGFGFNKYVVILCWLQNMALWRFQRIMYQHYLMQIFGSTRYKATLFSIINNISYAHSFWIVLLLSGIGEKIGVLASLGYGALLLLVFWPLLLLGISKLETNSNAVSGVANQ